MTEPQKPKLWQVVLRYENGNDIIISKQEIDRMKEAADALDMIHDAKVIAERLSRL